MKLSKLLILLTACFYCVTCSANTNVSVRSGSVVDTNSSVIKPMAPQEMIIAFIEDLKQSPCYCGEYNYDAADYVRGANPKDHVLTSIAQQAAQTLAQLEIKATDFKIIPDSQHSDQASVAFTITFSNVSQGYELQQKDNVDIQLVTDDNGKQWKIVPQSADFYLSDFYSHNSPPRKSTFTNYWASLIAYPQQMQNGFHLYKSEVQIDKLGKALFMCAQDYDEQINFPPQQFKEKILPYTGDESLFTAPGDPADFTSYSVNANIKWVSLNGMGPEQGFQILRPDASNSVPSPHTLVGIYLGHGQKLDFKYGGYSVVFFMDGHVEKVTPEQAKKLRWKP